MQPNKVWLSLHPSTLQSYSRYGSCIQNLELSNIPFDRLSHFEELVSAFPDLHTLTCSRIWFNNHIPHHSVLNLPARASRIESLNVGTSVDIGALEWLLQLACRRGINQCNLRLDGDEPFWSYLELLQTSMSRLPPLESLTLEILSPYYFGEDLKWAAGILKHISSVNQVRVAFEPDRISTLGQWLFRDKSSSATCKMIEDAVLAFPTGRILIRDPPSDVYRRAGRAAFWSPAIKNAFPRLDEQRRLDFVPAKLDTPEPVGHEDTVQSLVVSHDSKRIVTSSGDGSIIIWDTLRGTILHEWAAHPSGWIPLLSLSPDDGRLISADIMAEEDDERIVIWDIGSDSVSQAAVLAYPKDLAACAWSPDGALIAAVTFGGTVRVWDGNTLQQLGCPPGPAQSVSPSRGFEFTDPPLSTCMQFSPDARYLAWAFPYHCSIWRPLTDEQHTNFPPHVCDDVTQCEFMHTHETRALAFDPEGRRIATAHGRSSARHPPAEECVVRVWDVATGALLATLTGHTERVMYVSFSPDGRALLSMSKDGSVRIWDAQSGEHRMTLGGSGAPIAAAYFSPDGQYVATGSNLKWPGERASRLWRTDDGSCVAVFPLSYGWAHRIAFSPDGEFLVLGTTSGLVHILRLSDFIGRRNDACSVLKVE